MIEATNQTGCVIQGMLYNRWITILTRTETGSWRSEKRVNGKLYHRSSDIRRIQTITKEEA